MTDRLEPADPLCFSDAATVVLAKPPDSKVKITSKSCPWKKVLQRDQILEVRFLDGRIRLAPKARFPDACDRSGPAYDPYGPGRTEIN